jgi:tripartite-type tricarboxylate transporter receptor subunit TctC
MISRRRFALGAGLAVSGVSEAIASEIVNWVVPFSAGSAQDTLARVLAPGFAQAMGKNLVIKNKAGAGGTIGAAFVAKSPPDGSTLLLAASSHHLAAALMPQGHYHPVHNFRAASFLGFSEFVLVSSVHLQVASLAEFVKRAETTPRSLTFASSGLGSATHVAMATFLDRAGLELTHIPFKSTGETVQELLAGRIHVAMLPTVTAYSLKNESRLLHLALTGFKRSVHLPNLPTVAELGYPDFQSTSWAGFLVPKAVPDAMIQKIDDTMHIVLSDASVKGKLMTMGISSTPLNPEHFDRLLASDWSSATATMRQLQISPY